MIENFMSLESKCCPMKENILLSRYFYELTFLYFHPISMLISRCLVKSFVTTTWNALKSKIFCEAFHALNSRGNVLPALLLHTSLMACLTIFLLALAACNFHCHTAFLDIDIPDVTLQVSRDHMKVISIVQYYFYKTKLTSSCLRT